MTPSADQSAKILAANIRSGERFLFVRLGDADVPLMTGRHDAPTVTCDGEPLERPGLGTELLEAWHKLCGDPDFFAGDLCTMEDEAALECRVDYVGLCEPFPRLRQLHSEALLIHRLSPALLDFYRAVRNDDRRKILIAPHRVMGAACLFSRNGDDVLGIPIHSTHANEPAELERVRKIVLTPFYDDLILIAGGRAGKILAADFVDSGATVVDLGSALDPLYYGRTRTAQVDQAAARSYFSTLFWESQ